MSLTLEEIITIAKARFEEEEERESFIEMMTREIILTKYTSLNIKGGDFKANNWYLISLKTSDIKIRLEEVNEKRSAFRLILKIR